MWTAQDIAQIVLVGTGATAVMDVWGAGLKRLGARGPDYAMVGRWVGHVVRGTLTHPSIARAHPVAGERALGWGVHYAVGVAFAGLLVALVGTRWLRDPDLLSAVTVGAATVAAPLFVMQPAMGAGVASSRTPTPLGNSLRSLANHVVFGIGLYLSARLVAAACS
ncbi:MAG TPA: DUF2938 domain-containing protein [Burkholderiaceae bacterium]|nr:DUF2938 domain-containing protein [Burkholderiaceae bacterium]